MQRYLTPADYTAQIRSEIKTLVGGSDEKALVIAEHAAVNQMMSYLGKLYDLSRIFFLNKGEFDPASAYVDGDLVYYKAPSESEADYKLFEATEDLVAAAWNASKWALHTGRNPFVNLYVVDITLYHLHSKHASRLMPQVRADRYQDALDWLKLVGNGDINAELPQKPTTDPTYTPDIRFNSHPSENHRW